MKLLLVGSEEDWTEVASVVSVSMEVALSEIEEELSAGFEEDSIGWFTPQEAKAKTREKAAINLEVFIGQNLSFYSEMGGAPFRTPHQ